MTRILLSSVAAAAVLASASGASAQTEIQWWHAMGGKLGETVNEIAEGFNKTQTDYKIVPVFKGSYTDTMTAVIAAYRAKQAPHIVQVFEVGTANMMAAKGKGKKGNKKRSVPKSVSGEKPSRRQLAEILTWGDAHVDWKKALAAMPVEKRGVRPATAGRRVPSRCRRGRAAR